MSYGAYNFIMKRIFSFYKKSFLVFNVNKVEFYNLVSSLFNKMFKILVILFIKQKKCMK